MTSSIRKRKGLDVFLSSHQTKIKYYICLKLLKQLRTWELVGFYHWTSCKRGHRENSIRFSTFTHWGQIRLTNKTVWGTVSNISQVKHCTWSTQEILLSPNDSDYCLTQTIHCCLLTFPAEHIKGIFFPLATRPQRLLLNPVGGDAQHCVKSASSLPHLNIFYGGEGKKTFGEWKKRKEKRSPEVAVIALFSPLWFPWWINISSKGPQETAQKLLWSNSVSLTSKQRKTSTFPRFFFSPHNFNTRRRLRRNVALTVLTVFMHHGVADLATLSITKDYFFGRETLRIIITVHSSKNK